MKQFFCVLMMSYDFMWMYFGLTSPLSPNIESLGLGSCCPLMIFSTNWVFLFPGRGSSNMGLKAAEKKSRKLELLLSAI